MPSSVKYIRKYSYTITDVGQPPFSGEFSSSILDLEDTVSKGVNVPHWRKVIAAGGNATTAMSGVKWKLVQSPASLHSGYRSRTAPLLVGSDSRLNGNLLPLQIGSASAPPSLGLNMVSATNQALTRYYSNLASITSQFKGAVMTGELRETLSMIRHPARALRRGIDDYLRFLSKNARSKAKHARKSWARETWLEYSFGWRPLIKDLDGAIAGFYQSKWAHPIFEMVKGTGREKISVYDPSLIFFDVGAGHQVTGRLRSEEEAYVKFFGIQFSTNTGVPDSHSYGFAPWEFVPTVWELIPYSFLVDYFSNIGAILSSWSYRFIANGWTAKTERRTWRQFTTDLVHGPQPGYSPDLYTFTTSGSPGSAACEATAFIRSPSVGLDLPSLELRVPGRWDQWVNLVALTGSHNRAKQALAR
jgi:hypothetical protein